MSTPSINVGSSSHLKPSSDEKGPGRFQVGTLTYTQLGMVSLFVWILWGDFCLNLMELVVPTILPLKLKALGASPSAFAFITTVLPSILNLTICPWISFKSDRHRGRWGRRIPFILFTLPFLVTFLVLLGFSSQIGTKLHGLLFVGSHGMSGQTVSLVMVGLFMAGFQFFNMFVTSVFWYLFNDVVPQPIICQFLGLLRIVSGLANVIYSSCVLGYGESHFTTIFVGAAVVYLVGIGGMCLRIKEGQYPPPPAYVGGGRGIGAGLTTFFAESFSDKIYLFMFAMTTCWSVAAVATTMFNLIFIKEIGLSLGAYGKMVAAGGVVGMLLTYPAGLVADKYHPLRTQRLIMLLFLLITPLNLIFLVARLSPTTTYYYVFATVMMTVVATTLYGASSFPTEMRIFPKDRFGQFCSAQAMVRSLGVILGGLIAGLVFDALKRHYHGQDFFYRWMPAWTWCFQILAFFFLCNVYRRWKHLGGLENYVPPVRQDAFNATTSGVHE